MRNHSAVLNQEEIEQDFVKIKENFDPDKENLKQAENEILKKK
jgi:hypothetical protein